MRTRHALTVLALSILALTTQAQAADRKALSLDDAKLALAGAAAEAKRLGSPGGAVAVVDDGGHVLLLERWDNTFPAAGMVSIGEARTAAIFRKPSKAFEDSINKGRSALLGVPDTLLTPLQGGLPITIEGQVVGVVGVSGAASQQQDEELAAAGARAVAESGGKTR